MNRERGRIIRENVENSPEKGRGVDRGATVKKIIN